MLKSCQLEAILSSLAISLSACRSCKTAAYWLLGWKKGWKKDDLVYYVRSKGSPCENNTNL